MTSSEFERHVAQRLEGQTLGGYLLLRPIASGGMATVYLARKSGPRGFAQNAAVKIVHPHLAQQREFVEMFLDEARIVSCINHPNVCRVFDFGAVSGTYYLAMEYVRGETWLDTLQALREHPHGRATLPAFAAWVVAQACEGLHAAHEARDDAGVPLRIVHRDVSPQNLLIGYDGSVRVVDFGVAYAAERSHATRDGAVKGRYAYMAPEQMRGLPVDRRADLWSLGVILREALQGERLFARENDAATIFAVTDQPLPAWPRGVPQVLRAVCDRALARDPAERYPSARELGSALSRALDGGASGGVSVSEWMHHLFSERIAHKAALIRDLAQLPYVAPTASGEIPVSERARSGNTPHASASSTSAVRKVPRLDGPARSVGALLRAAGRRTRLIALASVVGALASVLWTASSDGVEDVRWRPPAQAHAPTQGEVSTHARQTAFAASEFERVRQPTKETRASEGGRDLTKTPAAPGEGVRQPTEETQASEGVRDLTKAASAPGDAPTEAPASSKEPRSAGHDPATGAQKTVVGRGSLALFASGGWADVFLGERRLGTTPLVVRLPAGEHTLTVYASGRGPARKVRVAVQAGEQTKHKLAL